MSVLVAVCCRADIASFTGFYSSLLALETPEGSEKKLFPGFFPHVNKESAIAYAKEKKHSHIFFLDDDFVFPSNVLMRLLEHSVPIITGPSLFRNPPFNPYLFESSDETGKARSYTLKDGEQGIIAVAACGGSGLLVETEVFNHLPSPAFAVDEVLRTDDLYFSKLAKEAGYIIWCALNIPFGHIVQAAVWPEYNKDKWNTAVVVNNKIKLDVPPAQYDEPGETLIMKVQNETK